MVYHKRMIHDCDDYENLSEERKKIAKDAETLFKFKEYDKESDTSIVKYIF
jgi:hypothetical protein